MSDTNKDIWPSELRVSQDRRLLTVSFEDGRRYELPAEYLRVESPSAEVQGHHPSEKITVTGKKNVAISAVEPTGNYAVRLIFDDGHSSGIYTWEYLAELGQGLGTVWAAYRAAHP